MADDLTKILTQLLEGQQDLRESMQELRGNQQELQVGQQELRGNQQELQVGQQELRESMQELRGNQQHLQVGQQELRENVQSLQAGQQELQQNQKDLHRHFDVMTESLRSDIRQVAEGVVQNRETIQEFKEQNAREHQELRSELRSMLRVSHTDLGRRLETQEGRTDSLEQRVDRLEAQAS